MKELASPHAPGNQRRGGPAAVLVPLRGLSVIDAPDGPFWWPEADRALLDALKETLREGIPLIEMDCNVNDPEFSGRCAETLLGMMKDAG